MDFGLIFIFFTGDVGLIFMLILHTLDFGLMFLLILYTLDFGLIFLLMLYTMDFCLIFILRADVRKNQTLAGNSQKIDFAHTFKFDTLSC